MCHTVSTFSLLNLSKPDPKLYQKCYILRFMGGSCVREAPMCGSSYHCQPTPDIRKLLLAHCVSMVFYNLGFQGHGWIYVVKCVSVFTGTK